ncbi:tyrosine-type recombinase/integrase [Nostoc flagelliforme FACHB-838]|jgi:integrase/recombinase XerC|uniref:Tyrosine-type recombinase/integrase n=1 Tax=Nostoc flagelliforme FACHB-838 TaxID=2692904 RepID=A0ABR8DSK6_9NOSO|nr:tyrosine-type recombinase/integrase [Nostoc flagelliforme]MBD2531890.1 tyrosine-type recombinase/integrase [Nostoc flagelliforme FACHB-838]
MSPTDSSDSLNKANPFAIAAERDLLAELLVGKRNKSTRHEYAKDLKKFFLSVCAQEPTPALVMQFLQMDRYAAVTLVLRYKACLVDQGLREATVNRRLAAIKSLVNYAYKVGKCDWTLADIKSEKIKPYRDTTGISPEAFKKMLAMPDRETIKGKRDYALLRLLWANALRREEISYCNIEDLDLESRTLSILGKGRGTQKENVDLHLKTCKALQDWLLARKELDIKQPLFISLRPRYGHRLTGDGIRKIVVAIARIAGISKTVSPHKIRHSSVTAALDASSGDVRSVQKLSRHANLNTLMIYDDNRTKAQGRITALLEDLV